jgi:hypothetical protein
MNEFNLNKMSKLQEAIHRLHNAVNQMLAGTMYDSVMQKENGNKNEKTKDEHI